MTSAISLRKYVKQQVRERSWLLILISVVSFLAIPVFLLMSMQNVADRYAHKPAGYEELMLIARKTEALHILDHSNAFLCICVVIAACLTAFSCFIWLYNKEKTDFYFGTAMIRKTQFHAAVLTGLIVAVVPYVVMTLIALLVICPLYGVLTAELLSAALSMMVWCILCYLAVTFVVTVALLLCGRSLPGVLMTAFFLGFGPCVVSFFLVLITGHLETYFTSFIERVQLQWYLSPVTLLFIPGIAGKTHYPVLIAVIHSFNHYFYPDPCPYRMYRYHYIIQYCLWGLSFLFHSACFRLCCTALSDPKSILAIPGSREPDGTQVPERMKDLEKDL